jgi:hypothetical protein
MKIITHQLPTKVIKMILKHVYGFRGNYRRKENFHDLYSCILVCRSWCKIGIPILWSSIFYPIQTTLNYKVISIYLKCLKKEKKFILIQEGIRLEDEEGDLILGGNSNSGSCISSISSNISYISNNVNNLITSNGKLLFKYPKYLKELNFDKFLRTIFLWNKKTKNNKIRNHQIIIKTLLELFHLHKAKIKYFSMNNVSNYSINEEYFRNLDKIDFKFLITKEYYHHSIRYLFFEFKILSLEWDSMMIDGLIESLSENCKSLESITLDFYHNPNNPNLKINIKNSKLLAKLISSQVNLRKFVLANYHTFTHLFIEALNNQALSLNTLEFYHVDFKDCYSFEILSKCENLKFITFENCRNLNSNNNYLIYQLINSNLPNLIKVNYHENHINNNNNNSIINNNNNNINNINLIRELFSWSIKINYKGNYLLIISKLYDKKYLFKIFIYNFILLLLFYHFIFPILIYLFRFILIKIKKIL